MPVRRRGKEQEWTNPSGEHLRMREKDRSKKQEKKKKKKTTTKKEHAAAPPTAAGAAAARREDLSDESCGE